MKVVSHQRFRFAYSFILSLVLIGSSRSACFAANAAGDLDQMINGGTNSTLTSITPIDPPDWVNGDANKSKAHLVEGYSQAYRLVLTGLSIGTHTVKIGWDTKVSSGGVSRHAIDFITHYQRLLPHTPIFGHHAETIQPLLGLAGTFGAPTTFPIPAPTGTNNGHNVATIFNSLPANERLMTMYNGTITAMSYTSQDALTDSSASTVMQITFTANDTTVVLAWGGHLARSTDWGVGNSAGNISGSSYHTRFIDLDGNGGNQDHALMSSAVVALNCSDAVQCTTNLACGVAFCDPDSSNPPQCLIGTADAGTVCSAGGVCTNDAVCDGTSTTCPANTFKPSTTICRPSQGVCDLAEYCTGSSATCPADSFVAQGTVCGGATAGSCSDPGVCSGTSAQCGEATPKAQGILCRAASGACDVADYCDGISTACPDVVKAANTICGTASDLCANAPVCDGVTKVCQAETYKSAETVCRPSAGVCDVAETCTGYGPACPADQFASSSTICRGQAGVCDVAETCTGSSATCPADSKVAANTVCRASAGACDLPEYCNGASDDCPGNQIAAYGTVCRAASGLCDLAEVCDGLHTTCPDDSIKTAGTVCRPAAGSCDVAEACDGSTKGCPADRFVIAGTLCRDSAGLCDPEEFCTGNSAVCPVNVVFDPNRDPSCKAEFCQTAGFWSSHAGTEKKNGKSQNITLAVIDLADGIRNLPSNNLINLNGVYGKLGICGENIVNTQLNDAASALESMCVSPDGDQRLQLVRQLTAASLNCVLSSGNPECVGVNGPSNISVEELFAACNTACGLGGTTVSDGANTISCIAALDCWNNGGIFHEATNFCQTGTCSLDGVTACNGVSSCPLYNGQTQSCVSLATTCHDQPLVKDGFFDFDPPGPAGSTDACNQAIANKCTVVAAGEVYCKVDSAP